MTKPRRIYKVKTRLTESQYIALKNLEHFHAVVTEWRPEERAPVVRMYDGKSFTVTRDGNLRPRRK